MSDTEDSSDDDVLVQDMSRVSISSPSGPSGPSKEGPTKGGSTTRPTAAATTAAPPVSVLSPPTLKPLRAYQAHIVREVQIMYLALQHTHSRSGPIAPVRCDTGVSDTACFQATEEGWCTGLRVHQGRGKCTPPPGSTLLYLPTGGGKTRIAGELCRWMVRSGGRVLFVVNRTKLVDQASKAFSELGLHDALCVWGEKGGDESRPLHISTVQALAARERRSAAAAAATATATAGQGGGGGVGGGAPESILPKFDLLILDEAHSSVSATYKPLWRAARTASSASFSPHPSTSSGTTTSSAASCVAPSTLHHRPFVLGLSATPVRHGDSDSLGRFYDSLVVGPSLSKLVALGVLVKPLAISCDLPQLSQALKRAHTLLGGGGGGGGGIKPKKSVGGSSRPSHLFALGGGGGGEGEEEEEDEEEESKAGGGAAAEAVEEALKTSGTLESMVRIWKEKCGLRNSGGGGGGGRKGGGEEEGEFRPTVVFAPSVSSSEAVARAFNEAGIPAAHVDGVMPGSTREGIYRGMSSGSLVVLSSVGVVSEGYDEPSVAAVLLLRPTASRGLYVQQVGRGLRNFPGKRDCLVLDFVQATLRHGPVTAPLLDIAPAAAAAEGVGAAEGGGGEGKGIPTTSTPDEAQVARLAMKARLEGKERAALNGVAYQQALHQESAKARSAAVSQGKDKVWKCPTTTCNVLNHHLLSACAGCGGERVPVLSGGKQGHMHNQQQQQATSPSSSSSTLPLQPKSVQQQQQQQSTSGGGVKVQQSVLGMLIPRKVAPPPPSSTSHQTVVVAEVDPLTARMGGLAVGDSTAAAAAAAIPQRPKGAPVPVLPPMGLGMAAGSGGGSIRPPSFSSTTIALPSPPPVDPSTLFKGDAFVAACARFGLPLFALSAARNGWEKEFLVSLASFITDGVPHTYKSGGNLAGKRPSDKQRDILLRMVKK